MDNEIIFILIWYVGWITLSLAIIYFIIQVPIIIAKKRGMKEGELTTITVLSWCGIFIGITWIIALIFALVWQPTTWIDKEKIHFNDMTNLEILEKLGVLKDKGVITEQEFQREKEKIIKSNTQ